MIAPAPSASSFPRWTNPVLAKWAPVFLEPIMGSAERLVVAVVAVSEDSFHLEAANALRRLECLYGKSAQTAIFAAQVAFDDLRSDLAARGIAAIRDPKPIMSGISVGEISEGEASSVKEVASSWMSALSSLYSAQQVAPFEVEIPAEDQEITRGSVVDRLPGLVMDYVVDHRPGLEPFFSEEVRAHKERRRRRNSHAVFIDFSGSFLVANFGTLLMNNRAQAVDKIKRRLWDLKVDRDKQKGSMIARTHEMIVQHPAYDDPQITERQARNIGEALDALEQQADQEDLRLRALISVAHIGDHILGVEGRALPRN